MKVSEIYSLGLLKQRVQIYNCTSVKRIVKENEDTKKAPSPTNKKQGIKQFKKLDDFDLSVIRRIIDQKMDKSMFSVGDSDDESDIEVFSSDEDN